MSHIFISYSRRDADAMQDIKQRIIAEDVPVWTDEKLKWGTSAWERKIDRAIRAAAALVILLSPDALESVWVNRELALADTLGIGIYPIIVRGDEKTAVPVRLINAQWLFYDADDFQEQLRHLRSVLRRSLTLAESGSGEDDEPVSLRQLSRDLNASLAAVRLNAVQELVRLNNKRAVPYLIKALENETRSTHVVLALIDALSVYKDDRAVPALIARLSDKTQLKFRDRVCAYAERVLRAIGTEQALRAVDASECQ